MPDSFTLSPSPAMLSAGRHGATSGPAGVIVRERTDLSLAVVAARSGQDAAARVGFPLPAAPRLVRSGSAAFLGIGPQRWLVIDSARLLSQRLAGLLGDAASVSDQSGGYLVYTVEGLKARDALAKGIGIDLHPRSFGPDHVAATDASLIVIILWRESGPDRFGVAVPRSFAGSFTDWLLASAAEFGVDVVSAA